MKIFILAFGNFNNSVYKTLFEEYAKRISYKIELKELKLKNSNNLSSELLKHKEAELILGNLETDSILIALDEKGKQLDSVEFARTLNNFKLNSSSKITFVIGGADGLDQRIIKKANLVLGLGKMTLPHLLARVVLIEQIYRAQTIINNHPYHRV